MEQLWQVIGPWVLWGLLAAVLQDLIWGDLWRRLKSRLLPIGAESEHGKRALTYSQLSVNKGKSTSLDTSDELAQAGWLSLYTAPLLALFGLLLGQLLARELVLVFAGVGILLLLIALGLLASAALLGQQARTTGQILP